MAEAEGQSLASRSITVLVVDDEPAVVSSVRIMLRRSGYNILTATGGAEALRLAFRQPDPIHVLVTDLRMPGMNGIELARALCEQEPKPCILFLSADLGQYDLSGAPCDTITCTLEKPFTTNQINDLISRMLKQSGLNVLPSPPPSLTGTGDPPRTREPVASLPEPD